MAVHYLKIEDENWRLEVKNIKDACYFGKIPHLYYDISVLRKKPTVRKWNLFYCIGNKSIDIYLETMEKSLGYPEKELFNSNQLKKLAESLKIKLNELEKEVVRK